ncbi:hypothetical protein DPMN_016533 [Dreissena polymorpha]|uniref:Uncharacterized protein n=1 Tax=Dreissena polymorpha TaxID=45954 RepID=A0A9D4NBF4_DREPO|nr:hypothetical protein DPMN_016533 [Dreissena polymorpha]
MAATTTDSPYGGHACFTNSPCFFQKLIKEVQHIEASGMADYTAGLTFAFELFENVGVPCTINVQQIIQENQLYLLE